MTKRTNRSRPTTVALDPGSPIPLYRQIYSRVRGAILSGQLESGERLPSTRALAQQLGVSRTTVLTAYEQLLAEGYVTGRVGAGTSVADIAIEKRPRRRGDHGRGGHLSRRGAKIARQINVPEDSRVAAANPLYAFRVGVPALDEFPYGLWARLLARRARYSLRSLADYQAFAGYQPLRKAIASQLAVSRGIDCDAEQIVMFAGAQAALDLAARVLLDPGDAVWMEEPGHLGVRGVLVGAGAKCVAVPVDAEGLDVAAGIARHPQARLAFVTPSRQFPLGVPMSFARRLALLEWARDAKAWVLEDDYDSEYRYRGRPIEALHALDSDGRVIYVGTFSKLLFPSLRIGYLVVPPELVDAFIAARRFSDMHPPTLEQAALTDFIVDGHFGRHIRRMRTLYAERSAALVEGAAQTAGGMIRIVPPAAGMHVVGWLPDGFDAAEISRHAAALGIEARPLSLYCAEHTTRSGLVLGYGAVDTGRITGALRKLTKAIRQTGTELRG